MRTVASGWRLVSIDTATWSSRHRASARPQSDIEGYRNMAINLRSSMTSDLLSQYNRALQEEHGVSINRRLIDQAFPPVN